MRRSEGGAKNFGVFRVKNHDFTPKNHIFSNFRGRTPDATPPLDPPLHTFSLFPRISKAVNNCSPHAQHFHEFTNVLDEFTNVLDEITNVLDEFTCLDSHYR